MKKIYALPEDELRGEVYQRILLLLDRRRGGWQVFGAAVGLFGGLLSIVLGALVWAAVGVFAPSGGVGSFLDGAGIVLFVLPLPLLALGAHCLDLLEKKAPALSLPAASRAKAPRPAPLNPPGLPVVPPELAFHTAASFTAGTDRQASTRRRRAT